MSYDQHFEEAGARFWEAAKALISLKNVDLLDAAADAMKQQAKEFAAGINIKPLPFPGPRAGCGCRRCIELREQIAAREELEAQLGDVCELGAFDDA